MSQVTPKKFITALNIIHLGFAFMTSMLGVAAFLHNQEGAFNFLDTSNPFFFAVPIIAVAGIVLGKFLYVKKLKELAQMDSLKAKLTGLQTALIIKYATIEGPALLGIVAYLKSGNLLYLIIAVLLLGYLYTLRPTKAKIENELKLNFEHQNQFNQGDEPLP